ncbi:TetR/AcrR family transcriptional regulator [Luteolibacter ambystomatis]|uniref:TetR/AcrR family transcriptional regulator n=1 Tax=Luteolibacter ambystomatis TaxID=2824561 RepID=A0A975G9T6_9BACT|nr:TetR/AcrR family transcriptional regulator [Luteolibacter ambystomatis]QUE51456.1 TetR/AcrR family transcriptional regulator [Luteolibacter ambystomatis]
MSRRPHDPSATRSAVLQASYDEFYRNGFQGGSLNQIVERADLTKGALFHHFPDKAALAVALVDERFFPALEERWFQPLRETSDPVTTLRDLIRGHVARIEKEGPGGFLFHGCPIANLATEMAPLDDVLRGKLDSLYAAWREAISKALERGQRAGIVHASIAPAAEAVFFVASMAGTATQGKTARDIGIFRLMLKALEGYLETLRAPLK